MFFILPCPTEAFDIIGRFGRTFQSVPTNTQKPFLFVILSGLRSKIRVSE